MHLFHHIFLPAVLLSAGVTCAVRVSVVAPLSAVYTCNRRVTALLAVRLFLQLPADCRVVRVLGECSSLVCFRCEEVLALIHFDLLLGTHNSTQCRR